MKQGPRTERLTCPTCGTPVDVRDSETYRHRPFCSKRCQLIDLGKWFNEEYVISEPVGAPDSHSTEGTEGNEAPKDPL